MRILGIVAEYNPFHNGHLYQLTEAKRLANADGCVVVMSGNFTQRGGFSLLHKSARAEAAIRKGADLVLELPLPFAVSTAEKFAYGGIFLLNTLCHVISCGCESATAQQILDTAELTIDPTVSSRIAELHKSGIGYAQARQAVIGAFCPELGAILSNPNDILAVEYQKAILSLSSGMEILPISRLGAAHGNSLPNGQFASAGYIRSVGFDVCRAYIPPESYRILERESNAGRIAVFPADTVMSYLRRLSPEQLASLPDVREGLQNRIWRAIRSSTSYDQVVENVVTKRYTRSRIQRILLSAYLDIDRSLSGIVSPPYIRILGMNAIGQSILRQTDFGSLPVISRSNAISRLSEEAQLCFRHECFADDLYTMAYTNISERKSGSNQRLTPYIE